MITDGVDQKVAVGKLLTYNELLYVGYMIFLSLPAMRLYLVSPYFLELI